MKKQIIPILICILTFTKLAYAQDDVKELQKLPREEWLKIETLPKKWQSADWDFKKVMLEKFYAPTLEEKELIETVAPKIEKKLSKAKINALVIYKTGGYTHTSILHGNYALNQMAEASNGRFKVTFSDNFDDLKLENISKYDVIIHNNTTRIDDVLIDYAKDLNQYIENGGGAVFIHAGSDCFKRNIAKGEKSPAGALFQAHPWTAGGIWAFQLESPEHRLNRAFGSRGFMCQDEVYMYKEGSFSKDESRVLVSLDMSHKANKTEKVISIAEKHERGDIFEKGNPVSWVISKGKGRVFNTNFGHRKETFWHKNIMKHLLDGIYFASGNLDADTRPSNTLTNVKIAKVSDQ